MKFLLGCALGIFLCGVLTGHIINQRQFQKTYDDLKNMQTLIEIENPEIARREIRNMIREIRHFVKDP